MHQNRLLYTLPEYQEKLRHGYRNLGIVCEKISTHKVFVFRPVPSTPWLPEGSGKYWGRIKSKAKSLQSTHKYTFATLTYSSSLYTSVAAAKRVKHDIDLFFKRLYYRNSKPEYFYVIELTKNNYVHVHLIFDRYVNKKKVFKSWFKVTGCTATKIEHLPTQKAIYYCLKYLSKTQKTDQSKMAFLFAHIDRLWTASRHFWGNLEPRLKNYQFWFSCWNKNDILSQYFDDPINDVESGELEIFEANLLLYDVESLGCKIYDPDDIVLRKPAPAVVQPSPQPLLDFYTNPNTLKF